MVEVSVYSVTGELVRKDSFNLNAGKQTINMTYANLPAAVYSVLVISDTNKRVIKMVKQPK